jgi:hypothetical protein
MSETDIIRCKDCKWWSNYQCIREDVCIWESPFYSYKKNQLINSDHIVLADADIDTEIYTGGNFGCVHGKRRSDERD